MLTQRTRGSQRGSVAVEFALVFPVLLTLLGMMVAIGLGLKARHQMLNYATAAARYCAFQKPTANMQAGLPTCVKAYIDYLTQQDQDNNMPPCSNIVTTPSISQVGGANVDMRYLVVEMTCMASWVPIVGQLGDTPLPGTTYLVRAKSSMPFMLPQAP